VTIIMELKQMSITEICHIINAVIKSIFFFDAAIYNTILNDITECFSSEDHQETEMSFSAFLST
jgi:hypothetical protein